MSAKDMARVAAVIVGALMLPAAASGCGVQDDLQTHETPSAAESAPADEDMEDLIAQARDQEGTRGRHAFESLVLEALDFVPYPRAVAWDFENNRVIVRVLSDGVELSPQMLADIRAAAEAVAEGVPVVIEVGGGYSAGCEPPGC